MKHDLSYFSHVSKLVTTYCRFSLLLEDKICILGNLLPSSRFILGKRSSKFVLLLSSVKHFIFLFVVHLIQQFWRLLIYSFQTYLDLSTNEIGSNQWMAEQLRKKGMEDTPTCSATKWEGAAQKVNVLQCWACGAY